MSRTGAAFDGLAQSYDRDFTETVIGQWLRERVHARLDACFQPGESVLELGCGTGEDARYLATWGVQVTATDVSPQMLDVARTKLADVPLVTLATLDLNDLPSGEFCGLFDGAFASFGPLNCVRDRQRLAAWLAARIRPGGVVALGVMGPLCLWEIGWHGLHGDLRTALRRLKGSTLFQPVDGGAAPIYYPSPRRLRCEFAPWFRALGIYGLGVFLPPSDVYTVVERRPRLLQTLIRLESWLAHRWPFTWLGDHYWIELERC